MQIAGVDLGSNSFHMVLGRADAQGRVTFVDRAKEYVRLAGGLDDENRLTGATVDRALACLARFGERLADLPADRVRVVGTNTLRRAKDADAFLERAEAAIGHPIDVISGLEEARLIFLGASSAFHRPGKRLVVDIGGGSTELILGDEGGPVRLDSLSLGCVGWTARHFPRGRIDAGGFRDAETAARRELAGVARAYRGSFAHLVGTSGTARAIEAVLLATRIGPHGVTPQATEALRDALIKAGHTARIRLPGVSDERAQVLPGGLAILRGVMRALHAEQLVTVDAALREGLLLELVGRAATGDPREHTVRRMQERFGVDAAQGDRVAASATALFDQVAGPWKLRPQLRQHLAWAARLHELGLFLRYSGHHKHGSYLIANADLAGFSTQEQLAVAALVLGHRGAFDQDRLRALRPERAVPLEVVLLLRLAVRLHRTRTDTPLPPIAAIARPGRLRLGFPDGWLAERPLTAADLAEERDQCARVGIDLSFA